MKAKFAMYREWIYFILINIILFTMRVRKSFPEFYIKSLHPNPDQNEVDLQVNQRNGVEFGLGPGLGNPFR